MKYFAQIASVIGILIGFLTLLYEKNLNIDILQKPLTYINIGLYIVILPPLFLTVFILLWQKEQKDRRVCFTYAQCVCLMGFLISVLYGFMSFDWLNVQNTSHFDAIKNTLWKLIDLLNIGFYFGVIITFCLHYFGYFPGIKVKPKKHIGDYAIKRAGDYGIDPETLEKLLENAYSEQKEDSIRLYEDNK